jgi:HSP90 family molecular chaperone
LLILSRSGQKKTVTEEVPVEEEAPVEKEKEETDDLQVSEDEDEETAKPKTKTVSKEIHEWKVLNTAKPLWTRNAKDITEEEYVEFYKSFTKDTNGYLTKIHFNAEGELSFRSILYIPKTADYNLYDKFYEKSTSLKLYVRKVLISDEFDDFLPRYLNFVKGVVDSDDLPLNVNRETLAQHKVLKVMAKKITRKVIEMLKVLADKGKKKKDGEEEEPEETEEDLAIEADEGDYQKFWDQYGKSIKLGVIDDKANKNKLVKLLRFITSKSNGTYIGLDEYIERMPDKQKFVYYITGESVESVENSPYIELLKKKDIEVVYMIDPLDEYVVQHVSEFEGNQLQAAHKADLTFDDDEKEALEKLKEEYKPLTQWLTKIYGKKVEKVTVGIRTTDSPAVLVTGTYGWSANMERIMKAQTFSDTNKFAYMQSKKTLEINPHHPIIKELKTKSDATPDDKGLEDLANIIYDAATVSSGFTVTDTKDFATRLHKVVSLALGVEGEPAPTPTGSDAEPAPAVHEHDDL